MARNALVGRRFLDRFKTAFTNRPDGSTWPKWQRTWKHAGQYFRALLRPGRRKLIIGLGCRVNADSERLERFVRECPWEHEEVEELLRAAVPEAVEAPNAALIPDEETLHEEITALEADRNDRDSAVD